MIKFLKNIGLKIFNKKVYINRKNAQKIYLKKENYNNRIYANIKSFTDKVENKKELNFSHSGHLGDLIYSLPLIQEIAKTKRCNFFIRIDKIHEKNYGDIPAGNLFIDRKKAEMLLPLLKKQKYLNDVKIYNNQNIDVDLDFFRESFENLNFHTMKWYSHLVGVSLDISKKFLDVGENSRFKDKIIIVRSKRYRNVLINYKFLKNVKNIICLGLKDEFEDLKKDINHLEYYNCKDFLEMAEIINSCKFLIGNQTFAFSIAEGLKVKRLLEVCPEFPVVIPQGQHAFDFFHQIHFEKYFNILNE